MRTSPLLLRHALIVGASLFTLAVSAQQTLIRKNGGQIACDVKGVTGGQVDYMTTGDPHKILKHVPCADLAGLIDESLIVHNDPCTAPLAPKPANCVRNCESLVGNDMRVTKGAITHWMDDRYVVRTRSAEVTVPRGDVVGVVSGGHVEFNLTPDRLQKLMADQTVIRAINNTGQCPTDAPLKPVAYSAKWAKDKFNKAAQSNPRITPQPKGGTEGNKPAEVFKDTAQRGLSAVLDFDMFKDVAMEKTNRLSGYIGQIADKKVAAITKDKVVKQALSLFERPDCIVHVSNAKTGAEKTHTVQSYLSTHLRRLPYDKVNIEWADLNYAGDFELQPDSSYKAVISLQQRFTGYIDGQPFYSDVTNKNVTITLRTYEKVTMGKSERLWDVFLSDIGVSATKAG